VQDAFSLAIITLTIGRLLVNILESCPGADMEDAPSELPAERDVADIHGSGDFSRVKIHVA